MAGRRRIERPDLTASGGPLYNQIRRIIEDAVRDGSLKPGDALPPERTLASRTGVSRVTVRRAVEKLIETSVLVHRQGSGTFVADRLDRVEAPLSGLLSLTDETGNERSSAASLWLERGTDEPSREEATLFGLFVGDRVTRLHRVHHLGNLPVVIERAVVPSRYLSDPRSVEGSLYAALKRVHSLPARARQRLRAMELWREDAALLGTVAGAVALQIERISYLPSGAVVERTVSTYRGDCYDFLAETLCVPD